MVFLKPSNSGAFEPITLCEDQSEITFYGWFRNNSGIFLQDPQFYGKNNNQLATERTWFRGYVDYKISPQLRLWTAVEMAYEPWYPIESGASTSLSPIQEGKGIWKGSKEYSEYKNVNDILREAYFEWRPSSLHSIRVGRQIAIWGEALTTRIGDVIHPDNQRFTFAFANLEDTRIPAWMMRGIHDIPSISSSFEWIVNPNLTQNRYRVSMSGSASAFGSPGGRFMPHPETRIDDLFSAHSVPINPIVAMMGGFSTDTIIHYPFSRDWVNVGDGTYAPMYAPSVREKYPSAWGDLRAGCRTTTTVAGYTFGISYFHTQEYSPLTKYGRALSEPVIIPGVGIIPGVRDMVLVHPTKNIIGFYLNKQLPWPGVLRTEATYVPDQPFNTFALNDHNAITRRDHIKYLIAYDLQSYFYPAWHKTAPFNVTIEHTGEILPNNDNIQYAYYDTKMRTWTPTFTANISTNWCYNLISTSVIGSFMPWGRSGLLMPIVTYTPPWRNESLSIEARYINIYGKNDYEGMGILRDKDMLILTTQFNW